MTHGQPPRPRYAPRLELRRRLLLGGWLLAFAVLAGRAVQLQVVQHTQWDAMATAQHQMNTEVPAPRGTILDRNGVVLAQSREVYKVAVAPRELRDPAAAQALLETELGISKSKAAQAVDPDERWVVIPGVFEPAVREALGNVRGIHLTREIRRDLPHGDLALGVIGRVLDGVGRGGIEEAFESVLRGTPGRQVLARDRNGRPVPGQVFEVDTPEAGGDVTLTIDVDLQEIAHLSLQEALDSTGALAGDLLITDPMTGEILALASIREGRTDALSALNTSYEPGSTLKPFTVAALLDRSKASLTDSIDVENGTWSVNGRVLSDVHGSGVMTLAEALRESSNVGVAKAALALSEREQYEALRDFGFGVPTGLPLPGETGGLLRHPRDWSLQSPQSLAIGYEISVTPVQMAMAYGALANGGDLMQPQLVRELQAEGGDVEHFAPHRVRRAVDPAVTEQLADVLVEAVESGTGRRAQLQTFRVAGKSGTARIYEAGTGYQSGAYFASFAGFFPADDPQLVVFVKLERPKGEYYGGAVAAPVTRQAMEAALAARTSPIDRSKLLASARGTSGRGSATQRDGSTTQRDGSDVPSRFAALSDGRASAPLDRPAPRPVPDPSSADPLNPEPVVPELGGLPTRDAVRRLHAMGLRVALTGSGSVVGTSPEAGTRLAPGDTVFLRTRGERR